MGKWTVNDIDEVVQERLMEATVDFFQEKTIKETTPNFQGRRSRKVAQVT